MYPRTPHLSPLLVGVEVGVAAPDDALRVPLGLHVAVRRRPGQAGSGEGVLTSEHDHQVSVECSDQECTLNGWGGGGRVVVTSF